MLQWPDSRTLTGMQQKDLSRVCDLLKALENHYLDAAVVFAPLRWECSVEKSRTDFYKDQKRKISETQAGLFRTWTPEKAVPMFDLRNAAGDPGIWNYLQPTERIGKYQEFSPIIRSGTPDHEHTRRWLRSRMLADGKTSLWDTLEEVQHEDGWWEYRNKAFDRARLPTLSTGEHAYSRQRPEWVTLAHAPKMEAVYAIVSSWNERDGGLASSGDKDKGQRYNLTKKGIYFHEMSDLKKCCLLYTSDAADE